MPKIIIPNAHAIYQTDAIKLTEDDINSRYFYNLRFLWLLEPGDAIILPKQPSEDFLQYFATVKNMSLDSVHLVYLPEPHRILNSNALLDINLLHNLRTIIDSPEKWYIQACYFNNDVLKLAEFLFLKIDPLWKKCITNDLARKFNNKSEFRVLAQSNNIPIPQGLNSITNGDFVASICQMLAHTNQVIVKQEFGSSGKGNIGVSFNSDHSFNGVIKTFKLNHKSDILNIWNSEYSNTDQVVVEAYYPNQGSFTAQYWVPTSITQEPMLLHSSEIRMEERWVGIQIPASKLKPEQLSQLLRHSKQFAVILQKMGYQGYLCCDAILTNNDELLFTEINVRPGAETHAYILASQLLRAHHQLKLTCLTRNISTLKSFEDIYKILDNNQLLFNSKDNCGVIILTSDVTAKQFEYMLVAPNTDRAYKLEDALLKLLL